MLKLVEKPSQNDQRMGARVKWLRDQFGESSVKFAERMDNFNQSTLSKIERGERPIPLNLAFALVAKLGLSLDFLYYGRTSGLSRQWIDKLLSTPEGLALIAPGGTDSHTDTDQP